MASAMNKVIAGDYKGCFINSTFGIVTLSSWTKNVTLDSSTVETYELITDEHRKSAKSGIARGLIGGALLGPVGMLAGGLSAKSKGIYQVAIMFKDGKKSLVEVDDKYYKAIIKACF